MSPLTRIQPVPSPGPAWLPEVRRDLAELGLDPSWPGESVAVPGSRARRSADAALRLLAELGLRPDRLVPSLDGGVSLAFAAPDRYAELEFLDGGGAVATCSRGDGVAHVWPVGSADLRTALHTISRFLGG